MKFSPGSLRRSDMGQRNLTTKVVGGVTFDPVYSVNDWGYVGFFVGHNYQ